MKTQKPDTEKEPELPDLNHPSQQGLTRQEAEQRLAQYGPNTLREDKKSPLRKLLAYFWGPIPWMIETAAILSAVIHHWEDLAIIVALLLLNAIVGFWQEFKAEKTIAMLKDRMALHARVKRDGAWSTQSAANLVPGDLVRIRPGDIIPADVNLMNGDYLLVDESALTGEALPVEKHNDDSAYSGSLVRQGEMEAIVTKTGENTFFGKTAQLVSDEQPRSHFQKAVYKIGDYLIVLAVALVALIVIIALFRSENMLDTIQFALVLTVAAIPVALPAVMSVTMAIGAYNLAKRQAVVRRLVAIEELAGMDVLCSDKTGTLTKNELSLVDATPLGSNTDEDLLFLASLASREENDDPIDSAIFEAAKKYDAMSGKLDKAHLLHFTPFDPVQKRTEADVTVEGQRITVSKGAAQVIAALEGVRRQDVETLNAQVETYSKKGYRALAVASKTPDRDWQIDGVLALFDPPREDTKQTLKTASEMGIQVKMITGDHTAIARQTAEDIGLGTDIVSASSLDDQKDRKQLRSVEEADGFAEVFPQQKYDIVESLQQNNHITGMTGDGVNDAPALKRADIGIAVSGATEVAQNAADIVLTSPGLSVIIDAIKESRNTFQRMNSYAIYRIAETIRVLLFITLSIIVFHFYPVSAIMIVLLALFNDAPIMAIANDRVKQSQFPEKWNMRVILSMSTLLGVIGVISSFGIFYIGLRVLGLNHDAIQSFIFLKLAVAGHLTLFITRTRGPFWSIRPSNTLLWSAIATKVLATLVAVYGWYVTPIGWENAMLVWGYAIAAFLITDGVKVAAYKLLDHEDILFAR